MWGFTWKMRLSPAALPTITQGRMKILIRTMGGQAATHCRMTSHGVPWNSGITGPKHAWQSRPKGPAPAGGGAFGMAARTAVMRRNLSTIRMNLPKAHPAIPTLIRMRALASVSPRTILANAMLARSDVSRRCKPRCWSLRNDKLSANSMAEILCSPELTSPGHDARIHVCSLRTWMYREAQPL